ncbi:MAG TPA: dihydroorotate dehydrogenase 2 [Fibrobacteria bacterium]|nr:dihydroorotate dehydrogenase 2 [Fibrobacteria bacterium]
MSDTLKIEQRGQGVVHHDYSRGPGDLLLEAGKALIRNPETRHRLLATYAALADAMPLRSHPPSGLEKTIRFHDRSVPITLASPIMLAAGGNKSAEHLRGFSALGFGAVSVGSATSAAREGNPFRPRMHMLPLDRSMSNSMGLNNPGIETIATEVDKALGACHRRKLALGISVADTPGVEEADHKIADVLATFRRAYRAADYIELNVSCPNTGDNRMDAQEAFLAELLREVMEARKSLAPKKAVFVKISPDLNARALDGNLQILSDAGVTGLVLFNTFPGDKARYLRMNTPEPEIRPVGANGAKGGISGRILYKNTLPAVQYIRRQLPKLTLFACGGVDHGAKVLDLLDAGADAVQCYTVLAYRWNAVRKMNRELFDAMRARGIQSLDGYAPPA